jgi:hypothetical protein
MAKEKDCEEQNLVCEFYFFLQPALCMHAALHDVALQCSRDINECA